MIEIFCLVLALSSAVDAKNIVDRQEKPDYPVLLVSLDGFRADKFDQFIAENPGSYLSSLVSQGVKADYMKPSFPTLTFPNHWTLVTGLYPSEHGIVDNRFYDSRSDFKIDLLGGKPEDRLNVYWWNITEPIWLTAKKQGLKTGCSFWPGSEVFPRNPDMYLPFSKFLNNPERIDELVDWLVKFDLDFATLYFDQPDSTGHSYGPDSEEYFDMFFQMDAEVGYLINALKKKNLYNAVNIIVVSDHGMSEIKDNAHRLVLGNYIDTTHINMTRSSLYLVSHIYPIFDNMTVQIAENITKLVPNVKAYLKKDVPEELHFSSSDRIGPIVVIADEGYALAYSEPNPKSPPKPGVHGYDNNLESMRTIFVASGPNFKVNEKVESFENVNVYPLMCRLLRIDCHQNSGSKEVVDRLLVSNNSNSLSIGKYSLKLYLGVMFLVKLVF